MATHTSVSGFVNAIEKYPAKVRKGNDDAVTAAAQAVKGAVLASFAQVTGDMRLSGVGQRGAKVGVNYQILKGTNPTATIKATGPAHFIERASRRHLIGGRRGRGRVKALLVINGNVITGPVNHPAAPAKHAWTKGVEAGKRVGLPAGRAAFHRSFVS